MINQFDNEALALMHKQNNDLLLWGPLPDTRTEQEKFEDELKYGIIEIDGKQDMVFMNEETMKAYRTDGPYHSLSKPLEELENFNFIRWARPMDF